MSTKAAALAVRRADIQNAVESLVNNQLLYYLALNELFTLSGHNVHKLLKIGSPEKIFSNPALYTDKKDLIENLVGFTPEKYEKQVNKLKSQDVSILTIEDNDYPELLREISSPPILLFYRGKPSVLKRRCLSIVGTRKPSQDCKKILDRLLPELLQQEFTIISGLALGVDTLAHEGTLLLGGITAGIKSCGIDFPYPASNLKLIDRIARTGLVLSEFPPGTRPIKRNFHLRNRIISGLSVGTLVVEADIKSGSLVTAYHAVNQNREVFAVPASILSTKKQGTNYLIQKGAKLVLRTENILEELNIPFNRVKNNELPDFAEEKEKILSSEERMILNLLDKNLPNNIDFILSKVSLDSSTVYKTLLELELNQQIKEVKGKGYIKV